MRKTAAFTSIVIAAALGLYQANAGAERQEEAFAGWSAAASLESTFPFAHSTLNTPANEGCPAVSVDGRYLLLATNRGGAATGLDIWLSQRGDFNQPWGPPRL